MIAPLRYPGAAVLAACAAIVAPACFYFSPINERPRARIQETSVGPYGVGDTVVVNATNSSDDSKASALEVVWQIAACDAAGESCEPVGPNVRRDGIAGDFEIEVTAKGLLVVVAQITDQRGASDTIDLRIPIVNRDPTVRAQITGFPDPGDFGGHVLGLPVTIAAQASDPDGDPLAFEWSAFPPLGSGSDPDAVVFEPVDGRDDLYQLIGDVAGVWDVVARVTDSDGALAESTEQIVLAPDGPPCLVTTDPGTATGTAVFVDSPRRFSVLTVDDALDAHPVVADAHPLVGATAFRWSLAGPQSGGAFVELSGHQLAERFIDPARYSPGDALALRVEVADRVARALPCGVGDPTCSIDDNGCLQRLTWEIVIR